jgi:hypothetical protein
MYVITYAIRVIKSRMRWMGHVAHMGQRRGAYSVLVGELEEKRPIGRPRRRCEDNFRMNLRENSCEGVDWIDLPQDRDKWRALVKATMNLRRP